MQLTDQLILIVSDDQETAMQHKELLEFGCAVCGNCYARMLAVSAR